MRDIEEEGRKNERQKDRGGRKVGKNDGERERQRETS